MVREACAQCSVLIDRAYYKTRTQVSVGTKQYFCAMATKADDIVCVRCGSDKKLRELEHCTEGHKMCNGCLKVNAERFGIKDMDTCPECFSTEDYSMKQKPIWIFVDDSNIWIEAKKLVSKLKRFKTRDDHRLRIDVGKLTDVVSAGRPVKTGILYGSEPPKIDSVWKKIKDRGWEVKTKAKSIITHKEKEVDATLLTDVMHIAYTTPERDRSTIILISGDADMKPAVERIIERGIWKVEIYMWRQGFSSRLRKLQDETGVVQCIDLDSHLEKVTFTNWRYNGAHIPMDAVVLKIEQNAFPKRIPPKKWWSTLESIAQWPMQGQWIFKKGCVTDDFVIVFARSTETYDSDGFVRDILEGSCRIPSVQHAETYSSYKKRISDFNSYQYNVVGFGKLEIASDPNDDSDDTNSESSFVIDDGECTPYNPVQVYFPPLIANQVVNTEEDIPDPNSETEQTTDDESFRPVLPRRPTPVHKVPCKYGKNCRPGKKCRYKHSQEDTKYFERRGGAGNALRKGAMCEGYHKGKCKYTSVNCDFAHGEKDGWCLACRVTGHLLRNCPKKN